MFEKVSIVIPVYNGSNYLKSAIDSALNQTYKNCEVIVINDGSNDGGKTDEIARLYGDKIRYFVKENGGVATAVNMGIELMEGDYFAWLSHDDMFVPDKIEKQMNAIHQSGIENAICHSNFDFLYVEDGKRVKVDWLKQFERKQLENSCFAPVFLAIHGSTLLIHRSHFSRVGAYNEKLRATQDSEFLFRVMRNQKSVFVEDSLMISRIHKEQGQQTMQCHTVEYNEMFIDFCEVLSEREKVDFCGSVCNFYFKLYSLLLNAKPANIIITYLREKIKQFDIQKIERADVLDIHNVCIFGAGQKGGEIFEVLDQYGINVECYVDNDKHKWGNDKNGLIINSPDYLRDKNKTVIVAMMDPTEVIMQLGTMNSGQILTYGEILKKVWYMLPLKIDLGE